MPPARAVSTSDSLSSSDSALARLNRSVNRLLNLSIHSFHSASSAGRRSIWPSRLDSRSSGIDLLELALAGLRNL
ncbi:hypothetical protein O181_079953 [Austropuccinia psidii MF-1]|uniref:Uncharacterized protein n=1 Tax=Austropuccinia psidii MF-1 TaxID=1389203 RepID=A0A9Q3FLZ9_9BASI|nr:hypothetical protein [Austropuccinia psidii MF-1]